MSDPVGGTAVRLSPPREDFVQDGQAPLLPVSPLAAPWASASRAAWLENGTPAWGPSAPVPGSGILGSCVVTVRLVTSGASGLYLGELVWVLGLHRGRNRPVARYREGIEHARHRHIHFTAEARPGVRKGRFCKGPTVGPE